MRAVRYHEAGDPSVLAVEDAPRPDPGRNDVLVEVRAASINPVDAKLRAAGVPETPKTTGSDLAGVVTAVGAGVDGVETGDRVFATGLHTSRFTGGSCAEFATVPTDLLAPLPESVSFEDGAAAALVGVTAWRTFVDHADLAPGETALIHGGNGGVGHVAVGLADVLGATPVATARPEYHEAVAEFGAAGVFDYHRDDLEAAVREEFGDADAVLDHLPETYGDLDVAVAAHRGDVVFIAGDGLPLSTLSPARSKELSLHPMSMSNLATHSDMPDIGPILERLGRLLAADRLSVAIDRVVPLEDTEAAHRAVMDESLLGKIVIRP